MATYKDPRFTTDYSFNYKGPLALSNGVLVFPGSVIPIEPCAPGYQPKRYDLQYETTVNDYPFHSVEFNESWRGITPLASPYNEQFK